MASFSTPGPGMYQIGNCRESPRFKTFSYNNHSIFIACFFKGCDSCATCQSLLWEDYYKGRKKSWCLNCYKKLNAKVQNLTVKARHCNFVHHHIGVPGITKFKTTRDQVHKLRRRENIMWIKYGHQF